MTVFALIADERRALADQLEGLTAEQWRTPSLCGEWSVHDVLAHLTVPLTFKPAAGLVQFVRHRFDIDATIVALTAEQARRPSSELVETLRSKAGSTFEPPGAGPGAPLTDIIVHGQDIRRPLGLERAVPAEALGLALDFLAGKRTRGFMPKGRTTGLALVATDIDWKAGGGEVVRGPALSLALALTGRTVGLDDLDGDGVAILRSRLSGS